MVRPPTTAAPARMPRLATAVDRILTNVAGRVESAIQDLHPSAEDLHELHRGFRRLRLGIGLWSRVLPARDREVAAPVERRAKRLARLVGEVRDRDVVLALFEELPASGASADETGQFHRFLARLRDDARTGRELLRASLRTERDAGLFLEIRALLRHRPSPRGAAELRRLIAGESGAHHARVRRAHRRASRRPTAERLHRLRIRLRQLHHANELIRLVDHQAPVRIPLAYRRLQDHIGHLHDLDVALATLDPDLDRTSWAERLRRVRRRSRKEVRAELERLALSPARSPGPRPGARSGA
jgi:CHAD domain-containing protein